MRRQTTRAGAESSEVDARLPMGVPLRIAVFWLGGTYLLFLLIGDVSRVRDLGKLSLFVLATILAFVTGYRLSAGRCAGLARGHDSTPEDTDDAHWRRWTAASGVYLFMLGIAYLSAYRAGGLGDLVAAAQSPGSAYFSRLRASQGIASASAPNSLIQVLTLFSAVGLLAVPFLVIYWRRLTLAVRIVGILGVATYAAYWVFIGTLKGLGDLVVFALTAFLVRAWRAPERKRTVGRRRRRLAIGAAVLAFVTYMVFNQADRLTVGRAEGAFEPNPIVAAVAGESIARGASVVAFYPTHGYVGLAYNLDTPFTWTGMRGASPALDSYSTQYFGTESVFDQTYPARTERRTGWPAGMYWATIYPWLASDLGFPGAILFMGVVGWWLARLWFEAVRLRSSLSLLLLAQLALLLAYVPANNQVVLTRPGLIGFVSLVLLYGLSRVPRRRDKRRERSGTSASAHLVRPTERLGVSPRALR